MPIGLMQVHGTEVVRVTTPWEPGNGPRADGMVTTRPDIALGIITADCAPILLADPAAGVAGVAFVGSVWLSTVLRSKKTLVLPVAVSTR